MKLKVRLIKAANAVASTTQNWADKHAAREWDRTMAILYERSHPISSPFIQASYFGVKPSEWVDMIRVTREQNPELTEHECRFKLHCLHQINQL